MASIVQAGSGNWSYTNNTGGNVRVIIAFFYNNASQSYNAGLTQVIAGITTATASSGTNQKFTGFGKHVTYMVSGSGTTPLQVKNVVGYQAGGEGFVDEFYLADGQSASVSASGSLQPKGYNILIVPEE